MSVKTPEHKSCKMLKGAMHCLDRNLNPGFIFIRSYYEILNNSWLEYISNLVFKAQCHLRKCPGSCEMLLPSIMWSQMLLSNKIGKKGFEVAVNCVFQFLKQFLSTVFLWVVIKLPLADISQLSRVHTTLFFIKGLRTLKIESRFSRKLSMFRPQKL